MNIIFLINQECPRLLGRNLKSNQHKDVLGKAINQGGN